MAKAERSDKIKTKAKISNALIKNPLGTQRELAEMSGVSKTAVQENINEVIQELPSTTKSDQINKIIQNDIGIVELGQKELARRLGDDKIVK